MPEPIITLMGTIEMTELHLAITKEEEVACHHADHGGQEDRERTQYGDKGRGTIDELPWLSDLMNVRRLCKDRSRIGRSYPASKECDECTLNDGN